MKISNLRWLSVLLVSLQVCTAHAVNLDQNFFDISPLEPRPQALPPSLDLLQTSIEELGLFLANGSFTSVDLIHAYLVNIDRNNHRGLNLRAVIQTAPYKSVTTIAAKLDAERTHGHVRGPLHGIPLFVKDNMATEVGLGMDTSAGNFALKESKVPRDADVVKKLREAGAIIIGKANMGELAGWKTDPPFSGWSAVGGQTTSAYVQGGDPLGSSAGSAVGVSAGCAAAALGSDTSGSVIYPASRAALYGIRPTTGLVSTQGVVPITSDYDTVGPIAFTTRDTAILLDALTYNDGRYLNATQNPSLKSIRFGLVRNNFLDQADGRSVKKHACVAEIEKVLKSTMNHLESFSGASVINVNTTLSYSDLRTLEKATSQLFNIGMKEDLGQYMQELDQSPVRTVRDLVEYNEAHADMEFPEGRCCQNQLLDVLITPGRKSEEYRQAKEIVRYLSEERGVGYLFERYGVDALVFSPELGNSPMMGSALGYAMGTAPMGYCENGQPFEILFMVKPNREEMLFEILAGYEAIMPKRRSPSLLLASGN